MNSRRLFGVERDRSILRAAAHKIIRNILERKPIATRDARRGWLRPPPLTTFKRLEPFGFGLSEEEDWWIFGPAECRPDLIWPMDVGIIAEHAGDDSDLAFFRTYSITAKEARGVACKFGPFMVRHDFGQAIDGQLATGALVYTYLGGEWVDAAPGRGRALGERDRIQPRIATAIGLRQRYEWAVSLGLEHSPTVRFATDATGIKDVFRVRDLPEGRDRREALLTWVTDHWRQDRHDPEVETYVRKHLRGAVSFAWRGMQGEILPAQFDLEQRERLIAEREAMRRTGADRRPNPRP